MPSELDQDKTLMNVYHKRHQRTDAMQNWLIYLQEVKDSYILKIINRYVWDECGFCFKATNNKKWTNSKEFLNMHCEMCHE